MISASNCAVIWDVDGTLVDTAEQHFQAWLRMATEMGKPFTRANFAATFGRRNPEIIPFLFGSQFGDAEMLEIGARKEEYYRAAIENGVSLLPGVRALLHALRNAGFRQAIGSSAPRANVDLIMRLTETTDFFDTVVAMEDTQRGKPDPQVFLLAAERLKVPPQSCVVFEDALAGIEAAKSGGMKCVAVTYVGHHPPDRLTQAGADRVVGTWEELGPRDVRGLFESSEA